MPVLGLLAGRGLAGSLGGAAHWIGGGLLVAAGVQMGVGALRDGDGASEAPTLARAL